MYYEFLIFCDEVDAASLKNKNIDAKKQKYICGAIERASVTGPFNSGLAFIPIFLDVFC